MLSCVDYLCQRFRDPDKLIIGVQLFEKILNEQVNLLINEDLCLLKSAFDYQFELYKIRDESKSKSCFVISNSILYILALIVCFASILLINDLIIYISFLLFILIALTFTFLLKRNPSEIFNYLYEKLIKQISNEKQSFKKLKELIDDNWSYSNSEDYEKRLKILKIGFRDVALKCLFDFREQTLLLTSKFPLKSDIDDNLISSFPDELYESYNNDEDLNAKTLKSLRQLIRLQISEFFKRVLLIFVQNYHKDISVFEQKFSTITNNIHYVFQKLFDNSNERQNELMSIILFHKSFYNEATINLICNVNKKDEKNECSSLWLDCRNVRKIIYRSISIMEECESILNQNIDFNKQAKFDLNSKFEILYDDLTMACDIVSNLQKNLKHKITDMQIKNVSKLSSAENIRSDDENLEQKQSLYEDELPKDEVFEVFIEEQPNIDTDKMDRLDLDTETMIRDAENILFWELKTALKDKAIEYRIREAKALGVKWDKEQIENEYKATLYRMNEIKPKQQPQITTTNYKQQNSPSIMDFEFNFNIAKQAVNQSKNHFNVNDEETFGDAQSDDENESN